MKSGKVWMGVANTLILSFPLMTFAQSKVEKPNVLIIMADDLDSEQLSCYGGKNLQTPHIDALAEQGLRFTNMICSASMCVPTRASLFTGLYPAKHGSYQNHKQVFDTTEAIGKYLADLGYTVALTGKNHSIKPESIFRFRIIPGFEPRCTWKTADYTVDSIKAFMKESEKPFCLFVMSINPHLPWSVGNPSEFDPSRIILPPHYVDTQEGRELFCDYLAEIRQLDNEVRDITNALRETGKDNNTMVIFLGEQGSSVPGGKWSLYDHGVQSSMIACMPGMIRKNSTTDAIVQYEDILPTLLELAGGPPIEKLDGKSFLPVLKGEKKKHREYAFGIHNNIPEGTPYPIRSIRSENFKLIYNILPDSLYYVKYLMSQGEGARIFNSWKKVAENNKSAQLLVDRIEKHPEFELYDLKNDPYELNNIALIPKNKKVLESLKKELFLWMAEQGDTGIGLDHERKLNN
jgi:arylsulfatase A-like enzyme